MNNKQDSAENQKIKKKYKIYKLLYSQFYVFKYPMLHAFFYINLIIKYFYLFNL